jgi:hypothetical protein
MARPNAVGGARRSGKGSCSSSGSGSGSGGGGVDSLLFLVGYFRGSGGGAGEASSFLSADFPSVKRSNALVVFLVSFSSDGCAAPCLIASAFFLRSSASFANLLEPPISFGEGRSGWEGTRSPVMLVGTLLQGMFANHPPAGGEI